MMGVAGMTSLIGNASAQTPAARPAEATTPTPPFQRPEIPPMERAGSGASSPTRLLRLDGTATTLLLIARRTGLPEIAYWGTRLPQTLDAEAVFTLRAPDTPNNGPDNWRPLITVLDTIGQWNFDLPGLLADRPDGTGWTADFQTKSLETSPGALTVHGLDEISGLEVEIIITLSLEDVLCTRQTLTNRGTTPLNVQRFISGNYLLPENAGEFRVAHGSWAREFDFQPVSLTQGGLVIESRRNRSHDHYPAILAGTSSTSQNSGMAYAAHLGWSGSHRIAAERMEDGRLRLSVGEYLYPGEVILAPGETLTAPPAYATCSSEGYAGCARAFQAYARSSIIRWPGGQMKPRPVLLNSWEGNYFDLDERRLMREADAAAELGVERFVLDDGWFGSRRDDTKGLGDWFAALAIFPNGLRPLSDHVHAHGMQFGLWYEPEMANPNSDLYRQHPDWTLHVRGRPMLTSRQQIVIDISRKDVSDYLFAAISKQVTDWRIDYIKWDFNRELIEAADAQGRAAYRKQVLALYALWDRLHEAHPELEIESCASGGGRADWGALAHTQRIWLSDNTSAPSRLRIQNAGWHFVPPEVTGCHISHSPNWMDGLSTTLDYRAAIAIFGHLGVELDPLTLPADESRRLKAWIALHKRLRPVLHSGNAQFADDEPARIIRGVTSRDANTGIYLVAQENWPPSRLPAPVRLPGLARERLYKITVPSPQTIGRHRPSDAQQKLFSDGLILSGAMMSDIGFYLPALQPQSALVLECRAI